MILLTKIKSKNNSIPPLLTSDNTDRAAAYAELDDYIKNTLELEGYLIQNSDMFVPLMFVQWAQYQEWKDQITAGTEQQLIDIREVMNS
jgi:hypothetical protein